MFHILLIVFGIIGLRKGEFKVIGNRKVYEPHGKMLGGLTLLGGLLGFIPAVGGIFALVFLFATIFMSIAFSKPSTKEKNEYVSLKDEMAQRRAETNDIEQVKAELESLKREMATLKDGQETPNN